MSEYLGSRYQYSVDIRFRTSEGADFFYEETISFIEWLSENYGIDADVPKFYNIDIKIGNFEAEIEEELELWQDDGLPILDYNEPLHLVSLKIYTESFGSFIAEIAENLDPSSIDVHEILVDEEEDMEIGFGDDEYGDESSMNFDDDPYDDFDDY
ncbi:hypothetical protein JXR93_05380 [bacterium]|nr:hypothetical protein [bacterium]